MAAPRQPDVSSLLPDEAAVAARRRALVGELTPSARRRRKVGGRRRLALALAATLALSGGVALAAGVFSADDVDLAAGVGCYSEPRLRGGDLVVTGFHTSADPLAKCARLWREGVMGGDRRPAAPHLVACSEPGAGVAVLPGPDRLCAQLGMQPLPADFAGRGREAGRAYTAWHRLLMDLATVPAGNCRSPEELAELARSRLAETKYRDVRVVAGEGACASGVDADGAVIAVMTWSRAEDRRQGVGRLAADAVSPLLDRTTDACIEPARFEAMARKALARAGLAEVKARVEPGWRPCVGSSYGFSPQSSTVSFAGESRQLWKANSLAAKKAERVWERRGWSSGSDFG